MKQETTLWAHSVDYRKDGDRSAWINRGFWIHGLPRILVACRLRGHKPVVDGTEGTGRSAGYRWVCCDRCGLRTSPQMELDPSDWSIGDKYPNVLPSAWPSARGTFGGQLLLGKRGFQSVAISAKVGHAGSEDTLAAHLSLGPIGALYLHTEDFGTGIQRRLNPTGYQSRVTELGVSDGILHWALWAKRDDSSVGQSRWRSGYVSVGVRDRLLGPVRYSYEKTASAVGTVQMPDGDSHTVNLVLERQVRRRKRGRETASWRVDWNCQPGIPADLKGSVTASSVAVSDVAVEKGRWAQEACAAIAADLTANRTRRGWAGAAAAAPAGDN